MTTRHAARIKHARGMMWRWRLTALASAILTVVMIYAIAEDGMWSQTPFLLVILGQSVAAIFIARSFQEEVENNDGPT